ncbi:unnamed protein product [Brachionus calyciflorus]|uniref:Nucleolar protein 11 C-terminal domain-containing protein n=1 Tax=Brachionus calyciflorus TaxID=104777 RepID=A0A813NJZ1_9BILA|nr:unnamed protein product [Brachionus calyciflorus]
MQLANELRLSCSNLIESKNTCTMYKFKDNIHKCIQDKNIDNRDVIVECMRNLSGILPSKLLSGLLSKAIELNDSDLCSLLVDNVQLLEESHAVECIKFFIRGIEVKEDENFQIPEKLENKLDTLFKKTYDYHLLAIELKRLSSNEFILCLQYLQNNVKKAFQEKMNQSTEDLSQDKMEIDSSKTGPNILQITDLFSCFVDAHFTHITLSTKSQEVIAEVLQLIENQLDIFFDLISIDSLIKEIKQNKEFQVKNTNSISDYFIEVLKFE